MGKRHKRKERAEAAPVAAPANTHFDNLIDLREENPKGYERLGEETRQSVERYEMEQLAATFEYREGMERLLELKERLPRVYDSFSAELRERAEAYAERKRAHKIVSEDKEA